MLTSQIHWQLNNTDNQLLDLALLEDLGFPYCDITTQTLFKEPRTTTSLARIISKHPESIIICGLPLVYAALAKLSKQCLINTALKDGDCLQPGETLLSIEGPANALVMAERIMLNFLQRLSAIATLTHKFVSKVQSSHLKILDTRKTTPGFRHLEKYAVVCGGGVNHRHGLYDALMIKDTHIDLLGGMENTLARLPPQLTNKYPVIVEVRTLQELSIVLEQGAEKVSRVLLDNMSVEQMAICVKHCAGRIATEASGNLTLNNIIAVANSGVDFASIGQLTHSAGSVDLSMKCDAA